MPGAYFRLALRRFGSDPERAARIAQGTRIDPTLALASAPDQEIELGQQLRQIRNLAGLLEPGWGLEIGRALDAGAHGALGVAAASAPRLADALSVIERFAHVRAPYFRLGSEARGRDFELRVEPQLRLEPEIWPPLVEMLFLSIQALVESALGRPMSEGRCRVDYAAPEYADRYPEFLHAPVTFDQATSALAVPTDWLPLPCPFADPALHRGAVERLAAAERRLQGEEFIVAQVERILEGAGKPASSWTRWRRSSISRGGRWCAGSGAAAPRSASSSTPTDGAARASCSRTRTSR
jgi:hypothetical protein